MGSLSLFLFISISVFLFSPRRYVFLENPPFVSTCEKLFANWKHKFYYWSVLPRFLKERSCLFGFIRRPIASDHLTSFEFHVGSRSVRISVKQLILWRFRFYKNKFILMTFFLSMNCVRKVAKSRKFLNSWFAKFFFFNFKYYFKKINFN